MERTTREINTSYYRLNTGKGMGNIKIDEWKVKTSGGKYVNETLEVIERETNRCLQEPATERSIQACAEEIVRLRRGQL